MKNKRLEYMCIWQELLESGGSPEGMDNDKPDCIRCEKNKTYSTCRYYAPNMTELREYEQRRN